MDHKDTLQRFLFDGAPVRGALVRLDDTWRQVLDRRAYPAPVARVLGEMMAASQLLSANLKFDGTLVMQLQGTGPLRLAVVEASSDRGERATAKVHGDVAEDTSLAELVGTGGQFVITLEPAQGEAWQGIVALEGDSLAQMLMNYMGRSEQLDTYLKLACDGDSAAGLLLQRLPDGHGDPDGWPRARALAETLADDELLALAPAEILHRLYHEETVRVFEPEATRFACNCSRERVGEMLKMLGGEEVGDIVLEQGSVEIACDFCNQRYVFDDADVKELFQFDVVGAVRDARH
ncbi:molecular chaperone Hsp33 [Crenobacter luteus]|uniref:33 kDa chaperonin n=1 Tax=Crenobacter luteus TaxID=1452487 RepID=A0A163BAJ2_9NEIS|nr:Hsp33 family molecular chaperone HslO [Crenobacter luteus]KZE25374.1 molecular chaperone Hsp33 [Crenobacter luteus]TCP11111.1 molecular chaperone Hsp33 [Crenobacter luteus]